MNSTGKDFIFGLGVNVGQIEEEKNEVV